MSVGNGEELYIEDSIRRCWLLCLQQSDRHVVNRDACGRSSFHLSVMGVAVQHHVCTMAIYDLSQTRCTKKGEDFRRLTLNGGCNG